MTACQELVHEFHLRLEKRVGKTLRLRVNDNRSTMLSVRRTHGSHRVSLHRIFLEAPPFVEDALVEYIRGNLRPVSRTIQAYIEEKLSLLDYRERVDLKKLVKVGEVYDLGDVYNRVNREYFGDNLDLEITWFGRKSRMRGSRITFGLFDQTLQLVKVHRMLDSTLCPSFLIDFVVYHEMLHFVCPSRLDAQGRSCHHTAEFREKERAFVNYDAAVQWIKENQHIFFGPRGRRRCGRT